MKSVRTAVEAMLGNQYSDLKVKRSPLSLKVKKGNKDISVDQLSDGEKCTIAMFGDLARRIALANPNKENPLEGEGIVLIDEIETKAIIGISSLKISKGKSYNAIVNPHTI